jgi:hypothetical protein
MNDPLDTLARLLAAEDHPHLADDPEVAASRRDLEASPELQAALDEARAFSLRHPRLIDLGGMPPDTRARISAVLREHCPPQKKVVPLHPWSVRRQFAWAAALVLLLAGMSVISSKIIQNQEGPAPIIASSPVDVFHAFVAQNIRNGTLPQHQGAEMNQLVSWVQAQGSGTFSLPPSLLNTSGIGCSKLRGPGGDVFLLCFKTDTQTLHLFSTCAKRLEMPPSARPSRFRIEGRETREWSDGNNVYLLITHDPGTTMPEMML